MRMAEHDDQMAQFLARLYAERAAETDRCNAYADVRQSEEYLNLIEHLASLERGKVEQRADLKYQAELDEIYQRPLAL